jgi:hypothetical protein
MVFTTFAQCRADESQMGALLRDEIAHHLEKWKRRGGLSSSE